jgi:hypothetical protein
VEDNLFLDVGPTSLGGVGRMFQIQGNTRNITIRNNTSVFFSGSATRNSALMFGGTSAGFVAENNILEGGSYGIIGSGTAPGSSTLDHFASDGIFRRNVVTGVASQRFPVDNFYPSSVGGVGFSSLSGGDYSLSSASPYKLRGTDGRDPGVNWTLLLQKTAGVGR